MIERLTGTIVYRHAQGVILDVNGVGYGVEMSEEAVARLTPVGSMGEEGGYTVWIYTQVKEDLLKLFGFPSYEERSLFTFLIGVNGVGPKLAMTIMSRLDPVTIVEAVLNDEPEVLRKVPGVAERSKTIVLDLKKKLAKSDLVTTLRSGGGQAAQTAWLTPQKSNRKTLDPKLLADLRSALENLGYKEREMAPVLKAYELEPPAAELESLLRAALSELSGHRRQQTTAKPASRRPNEELF